MFVCLFVCLFLFFFHFIGDMLSKRYLKFASFNVEGLRNKLDDINFKNEISKFDFITLVETWLPADEQVNLEGYTSFSLYRRKHPRAKPASGGITLLVKEQMFQGVTICKCDDDRFLWWKLDRNFFGLTDDIFVCSVYLPPYTSKTYVSESNKDRINCFITFRDQLSYFGKKGKIILYGDFYARTGNLDDFAEDVSWVSNCRLGSGVSEREHVIRRGNRDHSVNIDRALPWL